MHLALDRNIRIRHTGRKQLSSRTKEERQRSRHLPPLLHSILHLLKQRILQNRVNNQHQRGHHTGKQGLGSLILEQRQQCADSGRLLGRRGARQRGVFSTLAFLGSSSLARGHARVDHPDGVGQDDGGGAGDGAGDHALDGGQLLGGPPRLDGGGLEEGARPFVPVVIDEVGDGDSEQGRRQAAVETGNALARNDLLDGGQEGGVDGALGFDLGAGGEGD